MQNQIIANRYRLNQQMKFVSEASYYAATDTKLAQPVTVRTIDTRMLGGVGIGLEHLAADKLRKKVENEEKVVRKLHRLSHPGLLKILDDGFDDPIYYHVYPPFSFENLQMRVEQQPLETQTALRYMLQAAQGLLFLHENGIVHCDISMDNLLVTDDQIKIVEFSIANFNPVEGIALGNPFYMSPEAVLGKTPTPARDIWALGVTMVYVLTGELPFGCFDMPRPEGYPILFQQILREPPKVNGTHLPPRLNNLIHRMLEKDAGKRIEDMQEVVVGLEAIL